MKSLEYAFSLSMFSIIFLMGTFYAHAENESKEVLETNDKGEIWIRTVPSSTSTSSTSTTSQQKMDEPQNVDTKTATTSTITAAQSNQVGKRVECSELKEVNDWCVTSKNKCFKLVLEITSRDGIGLQERGDNCDQDGPVWAHQLQQEKMMYANVYANAIDVCPPGTGLPKIEDFVRLRESVDTEPNPGVDRYYATMELNRRDLNKMMLSKKGQEELDSLLPDMKNHWWWSRSIIETDTNTNFDFGGNHGDVDYTDYSFNTDLESARCIRSSD